METKTPEFQPETPNPEFQPIYHAAQEFMTQTDTPAWLIYDYRQSNPAFRQLIRPSGHVTRPCYFHLPASGSPTLLTHHVDAGKFAQSGVNLIIYSSRQSMLTALTQLLAHTGRLAMEYSPQNELPRVSRVDAGTIELIRSLGPEIISSADLMQAATQRWTPEQLTDHQKTAQKLGQIVNQAFAYAADRLAHPTNEYDVAQYIRQRFTEESLTTPDGPIVAVNANASDPHYEPTPDHHTQIRPGDWLLIDLWAKATTPNSVYADITWCAYAGQQIPTQHQKIFQIVTNARDAALEYLQESHHRNHPVQGWQADQIARHHIESQGYGPWFTHRLGHSIGQEVHSEAVNLDNYETHDTRQIIPNICFSIEPGIYLPEFGARSEIDVYTSPTGPHPTSPVQRNIVKME